MRSAAADRWRRWPRAATRLSPTAGVVDGTGRGQAASTSTRGIIVDQAPQGRRSGHHDLSPSPSIPPNARSTSLRDETILSAAIRAGVGLPYGCRDGACGSCKSKPARRPRDPRRAPAQGAVGAGGGRRPDPHLLRHAADRLRGRGPQGGGRRRVPHQQDARPRAEPAASGRRRRHRARAAARHGAVPLPRRPVRGIHPARRRAPQLLHGQRAAQPRHARVTSSCTCATCRAASSPTTCSAR